MSLRIKNSGHRARVPEQVAVCLLAVIASEVYADVADADAIITSGLEGKHSRGSAHYRGAALDFRTRHIDPPQAKKVSEEMQRRLGSDYRVILEEDHIHAHWEPRGPYNLP